MKKAAHAREFVLPWDEGVLEYVESLGRTKARRAPQYRKNSAPRVRIQEFPR